MNKTLLQTSRHTIKNPSNMNMINLLFKNGKIVNDFDTTMNSNDFLKKFPRGAYTAMRTLHRNSIFQLKFHTHRLIYTTTQMIQNELLDIGRKSPNSESLIEPYGSDDVRIGAYPLTLLSAVENDHSQQHELFFEEAIKILAESIAQYSQQVDGKEWKDFGQDTMDELKITLLLVWYHHKHDTSLQDLKLSTTFDLYAHITKLGERPQGSVVVDIMPGSRTHLGNAKDSIWILERNTMMEKKTKEANEVLMCEEEGTVREGLSSNFFIIRSNKVITAKDGILFGSVRGLLIPTRDQAENILDMKQYQTEQDNTVLKVGDYIEENPNLSDLLEWDEAFISSTSRLVLPIRSMNIHKACIDSLPKQKAEVIKKSDRLIDCGAYYSFSFNNTSQSEQIYKNLITKMQSMSTRVLGIDSTN